MVIPVLFTLFLRSQSIRKLSLHDYEETTSLVYDVSEIELEGNEISISGWVVFPGVSGRYNRYNRYIWVKNDATDEIYSIRVRSPYQKRRDVTQLIGDGVDYREAGFELSMDLEQLELAKNSYTLFICYQYMGKNLIADLGVKISYGEIGYG